jgi:hypothetical protein
VGHHHQAKANTSGPTTKAHRKAGRADHRSQNANLEVRRWSAVRATIVFARRQSDKPFWPLGLCIAWLMSQDLVQAVKLFARLRLGLQYDRDEWATARTKLMNRLGEGRIQAFGLPPRERKRIEISAVEWMDLWITQRGAYEEVHHEGRSLAYHDARIAAAQICELWCSKGSPSAAEQEAASAIGIGARGQRVVETRVAAAAEVPPSDEREPQARPETPAGKRARDRLEAEKGCPKALMELMAEAPNAPISKSDLRKRFPNLSWRGFERAFAQSAVNAGCPAWSSAGRRRKRC